MSYCFIAANSMTYNKKSTKHDFFFAAAQGFSNFTRLIK